MVHIIQTQVTLLLFSMIWASLYDMGAHEPMCADCLVTIVDGGWAILWST